MQAVDAERSSLRKISPVDRMNTCLEGTLLSCFIMILLSGVQSLLDKIMDVVETHSVMSVDTAANIAEKVVCGSGSIISKLIQLTDFLWTLSPLLGG